MNKEGFPSPRGFRKKLKKILMVFIVIVLIISSIGLYKINNKTLGYQYYKVNENENIFIGASLHDNLLEKTIDNYIKDLENKGYVIASSEFDYHIFTQKNLVRKSEISDEYIEKQILNSLTVEIFTTKLIIKNDDTIYYFKNETECNDFINKLNEYIAQEYSIESSIEESTIITSDKVLEQKKDDIIKQKETIDKEIARKAEENKKITSRSSSSRISNYKDGVPLASYIYISSPYGMRNGTMHTGVDFAAAAGTAIYAWKDGIVKIAKWNGGYGNFIEIQHNDGTVSRYGHMKGYAVSAGQKVSKGQVIGYVGSTGDSTGNHLHFEIKINGNFVNPLNYL